jgi:hypothetical protein
VSGTPSVQRFSPFAPSAEYSTATIGGSGYFDGSGDCLRLSAAINLSGNFTAEAFVYSDSTFSGQNQIFGSDLNTTDGNKQLYIATSTYKLTIYDGSAAYASSGSVPQNQWSHVAISRQGSTITFYINGVASGTATVSATMSFRIVGGLVTGSFINEQFKGYISSARIVSGTAVYTSNFTPPAAPLTAITNTSLLCNFTNAAIFDNAMMNNLETVGNAQISTSVKKFGTGSIYFDGSGDSLVTPNNPAYILPGDFTIEGFVYILA